MIQFENITKSYGTKTVLNNVSVEFSQTKTTALLGPNGSGKSTMIKSILGLVKPESGTITINGTTISNSDEYRQLIGFMAQVARYPDNLSIDELFSMIEDVRLNISSQKEDLITLFELQQHRKKPMKILSGGTRQKVGAVAALMFDSPILILDEPSVGLDPRMTLRLKEYLLEEKHKSKTIILTTHILHEVEELADELIFLLEGSIIFKGNPEYLLQMTAQSTFERAIAYMLSNSPQQ